MLDATPSPNPRPRSIQSQGKIRGLLAYPITPADEQGRVDTPALERLLDRLIAAEVDGVGLLGSTGTYAYLTRAERRRTTEAAAARIGRRFPLLVGIGALRTDDVLDLARDAEAAGTDALLLAPVSYTPLNDREVFALFEAVAGAVATPICVYNNPGTTHFTFSHDLVVQLSRIPNVIGVKNPAPPGPGAAEQVGILRAGTGPDFSLGYSTDWNAAEALLAGGEAWHSVAAGLFPEPCLRLMRAVQAGRDEKARAQNAALRPLWDLFQELSSLRVMFAAACALGVCRADPPRPILPLLNEDRRRVERVLADLQLA